MVVDTSTPHSRRAILLAAVGGAVAAAATAVGRASPGDAADGDTLQVGGTYTATTTTEIDATGSIAFAGHSDSRIGVRGSSHSGIAVYGQSLAAHRPAIAGHSANNTGVQGYSGPGDVLAAAPAKVGIFGFADQDAKAIGVYGQSYSGNGVVGSSNNMATSGVWGNNTNGGYGVSGSTTGGTSGGVGVWGSHDGGPEGVGVQGTTPHGTAVYGYSGQAVFVPDAPSDTAVYGRADHGRGGVFRGAVAQLRLVPATATSHPSSGSAGDVFLDKHNRLWFCKGGTTWVKLA
jgi:hypothetical protein